jgi:ParB family chromosome partitioning protein
MGLGTFCPKPQSSHPRGELIGELQKWAHCVEEVNLMNRKNGDPKIVADGLLDKKLDRLSDRYLSDPGSLSLEEQREIYSHFMNRIRESNPTGREAEMFRKAVESVDRELEQAQKGEPGYIRTSQGTYRKVKTEMKWVPINLLMIGPECRDLFRDMEGEDFEQLKSSIGELGLIQPIIVDQEMRVISGHQRLRAARALSLESVPVVVHQLGEDETRLIMIIEEHIRRRHLQPSEMARAIKKLLELKGKGYSADKVAQEIGLSKRQVNRYRGLDHLIPEFSSLLDFGKLTQQVALQISELEEEVQRELYEALGERITKAMEEQKAVEFETIHAGLLSDLDSLSAEVKTLNDRESELKAKLNEMQDRLDHAEFKVGDEIKTKKTLEEMLQKTRAEMYEKVQEKQALIDKLTKSMEPAPDYQVIKSENTNLKAILKELETSAANGIERPELLVAEIQGIIMNRLLSINPKILKGKLPPQIKEQVKELIHKLEAWLDELKQLVNETAHEKKR